MENAINIQKREYWTSQPQRSKSLSGSIFPLYFQEFEKHKPKLIVKTNRFNWILT